MPRLELRGEERGNKLNILTLKTIAIKIDCLNPARLRESRRYLNNA
jgi:hypothetical protein